MKAASPGEDWRAAAACAEGNAWLFFASSTADAAAICQRCPVRAECLYDALEVGAPNGVWGGLTREERDDLPALPDAPAAAIAALRDHLDQLDAIAAESAPADMDHAIPNPRPAEPKQAPLPVGQLLAWAADHTDAKIRKAATQARDALDTLRARHHADEQLKSIDEEAAALERRLALLREQKAALAGKPKPAAPRDYEPVDVRAWAATQGIELPPRGRVPQAVVDSWRKAGAPTRQQ
jgi:WhiB family redox-sensing transcriptional regulator